MGKMVNKRAKKGKSNKFMGVRGGERGLQLFFSLKGFVISDILLLGFLTKILRNALKLALKSKLRKQRD